MVQQRGYLVTMETMKRCLIEECTGDSGDIAVVEKKAKSISITVSKMYKNSAWYKYLCGAEKSSLHSGMIKKVHYKFEDSKEMVEEYNMDTKVLLRRAWKNQNKIGGEGKWVVEVGDPIPDATPGIETVNIIESKDQPIVTRRNTRVNLEWRIRNLPYPIDTYSISANKDDKCITVRTSNKKFFKKFEVPELERLKIPLDQTNVTYNHQFNTLIITYKKPQQLLEMDKEWYEEIVKIKPTPGHPDDCKAQ